MVIKNISEEDICELRMYYSQVRSYLDSIIVGEKEAKNVITAALLCDKNSRMLFTGPKGTGKTTLAKALMSNFKSTRIQITSDILPSDIIRRLQNKSDIQMILLDEFNRGSGKAHSSLIELMAEAQITTEDDSTIKFPELYSVIATQNPRDFAGLFNVSDAALDRFDISVPFGNISRDEFKEILRGKRVLEKKTSIPLKDIIDRTSEIIEKFTLTETDLEALTSICYATIDNATLNNGEKLFNSHNIRAHEFATKIAKMQTLMNGRDNLLPADLVDFISNIYLHRIDQRVAKMDDIDAKNKMEEIKEKILGIKIPNNVVKTFDMNTKKNDESVLRRTLNKIVRQ